MNEFIEKNSQALMKIELRNGFTLIQDICARFAIAELAVKQVGNAPWLIEEKFNKRRDAYEFDEHLQNILERINGYEEIQAYPIECGNSHYYKLEVVFDDRLFLHFQQSFGKNAKYNKKYLMKNTDDSPTMYAFFLYSLDEEKCNVKSLKLIIPNQDGSKRAEVDLMGQFRIVKALILAREKSVLELLEDLSPNKIGALEEKK